MKKKIAKVSAASLITLSMTVGNVAAFNNHDDLSVEDESSNDKNIDLNSNSTTELENNSSIETKMVIRKLLVKLNLLMRMETSQLWMSMMVLLEKCIILD